jgi:hypothetical protein
VVRSGGTSAPRRVCCGPPSRSPSCGGRSTNSFHRWDRPVAWWQSPGRCMPIVRFSPDAILPHGCSTCCCSRRSGPSRTRRRLRGTSPAIARQYRLVDPRRYRRRLAARRYRPKRRRHLHHRRPGSARVSVATRPAGHRPRPRPRRSRTDAAGRSARVAVGALFRLRRCRVAEIAWTGNGPTCDRSSAC